MNQLITATNKTMSSREIADVTGKDHSNVKRDIASTILQLNYPDRRLKDCPVFDHSELKGHNVTVGNYEHAGNTYAEFFLDYEMTMLLVSGYSVALRHSIIKRWQELESQQAPKLPESPKLPATYLEALEHLVAKEKLLLQQAPKVAFVDNCVERSTLLTASQVAQKHKMSAIKLNKFLDELGGVYNKGVKRGRVFCQPFIDKGYGELKQTELGHSQTLFTTLGEQWINEKLISEGAI